MRIKLLIILTCVILSHARMSAITDGIWYWEETGIDEAMITGIDPEHAEGNIDMPDFVYKKLVDEFGDVIQILERRKVTYIADGVFKNNNKIKSVTLPSYLTVIGESAFDGCTSLKKIVVPSPEDSKQLAPITFSDGWDAFLNCPVETLATGRDFSGGVLLPELTELHLLKGVTKLPALLYSTHLSKILTTPELWTGLEASNPIYQEWVNGCILPFPEGIVDLTDPDWNIDEYEWGLYNYDYTPITDLLYGATVEVGSQNSKCSTIESVCILNAHSIWDAAFSGCRNLKQAELPDFITRIDPCTFDGCVSLSSVNMPTQLKSIGSGAFRGCTSLPSIDIPSAVNLIEQSAFAQSGIKTITLPDSITEISERLFYNCIELESIHIPDGVTTIEREAFAYCRRFHDYEDEDWSKIWISGMKDVYIPASVKEVGEYAFADCFAIENVYSPDLTAWMNIKFHSSPFGGNLEKLNLTKNLYIGGELCNDLIVPQEVTEIGDYCFSGCTSLTSVKMHDSITKIGRDAFYNGINIGNIQFGKNLEEIGHFAFADCKGIKSINLPSGLKHLGEGAFYGCNNIQGTVELPINLERLAPSCFRDCGNLTGVTLQSYIKNIWHYTFANCSLTHIPDLSFADWISAFAFANNNSLTDVNIPKNVKAIGSGAFNECKNLFNVIIEDSEFPLVAGFDSGWINPIFGECPIESIYIGRDIEENNCKSFGDLPNLKKVSLGKNVSSALSLNCASSRDMELLVSYAQNPPEINEFTEEQYAKINVVVPDEAIEAYKAAPIWKNFFHIGVLSGIGEITENHEVIETKWYDMQGKSIENPSSGLFMKEEIYSDGSHKVIKIML